MFKEFQQINTKKGMTYVELIVVLSIFSIISTVVVFNYGAFQSKVDIKNLANDVALKIVEAQKSSTSGDLSTLPPVVFPWRPSYGLYFDTGTSKSFIYFTDLNNSGTDTNHPNYPEACDDSSCIPPYSIGGEVNEIINITRGSFIGNNGLEVFGPGCPATVSNLSIVFKRPSSTAVIASNPPLGCTPSYVSVNLSSPYSYVSKIKIYPSGRIQLD
ncbi:MAG: type II secretion system protein [Patescibacteria group bacterium]